MTRAVVVKCSRCQRRLRNDGTGWNATVRQSCVVGYLCPDCQTPEENAEAEINLATLDYRQLDEMAKGTGTGSFKSITFRHDAVPDADDACAACRRATDTGLATVGEAEWHLAFALGIGIADDVAEAALRDYTGAEPGKVIDGRFPVRWRVCRDCAHKVHMEPGPLGRLIIPGYRQK